MTALRLSFIFAAFAAIAFALSWQYRYWAGHVPVREGDDTAFSFFTTSVGNGPDAGASGEGKSVESAKDALRNADAVCFDVDSTVVVTEAIDLLADCFGVYKEVSELTKKAMEGNANFRDALRMRLEIMQPTEQKVEECVAKEKPRFSDGMEDLVAHLRRRGVAVFLVSGGFRVMIKPVAKILKIPLENVWANKIIFDVQGRYVGFDESAPTSRDGGKPEVIRRLKKTYGYRTVVMIGDGATDMDACPPADAFIGYGGVQVRAKVRAGADWFVMDWKEVVKTLG